MAAQQRATAEAIQTPVVECPDKPMKPGGTEHSPPSIEQLQPKRSKPTAEDGQRTPTGQDAPAAA
eukprot:11790179-Alexandrium_andersonii.AAC.1